MSKATILCLLLFVGLTSSLKAAEGLIAKRIIYLGNVGTARAKAFEDFLRGHFAEVTVADRSRFAPSSAKDADVVLLDWSGEDSDADTTDSPLGPREEWATPTVLLDCAGPMLARLWQINGGDG